MTIGRRYLVGVATVAAAAAGLNLALPGDARGGVWLALGVALAAQGPLGWWLVRVVGTERFLLVWAVGIAARFALVTACGLVVVPRLALAPEPMLVALVVVLMAFVLIEAVVVQPEQGKT
ncbi:MAG TPA: hypothetical protein VEU55_01165 [Gemmatimonadales bacterium]|nr:hypothetical protein [Gemmatimonadales bacterium]